MRLNLVFVNAIQSMETQLKKKKRMRFPINGGRQTSTNKKILNHPPGRERKISHRRIGKSNERSLKSTPNSTMTGVGVRESVPAPLSESCTILALFAVPFFFFSFFLFPWVKNKIREPVSNPKQPKSKGHHDRPIVSSRVRLHFSSSPALCVVRID